MDSNSSSLSPLLSSDEVATIIGCTVQWLCKLRKDRSGPPFIQIGTVIRYRTDDLERWLDEHCVVADSGSPAVPVPAAERTDIASRVASKTAAA